MPSFNLAVPFAAKRVSIVPSPAKPAETNLDGDEGYSTGFDAGYRAGLLQASLESRRRQKQDALALEQSLETLGKVKAEVILSIGKELPPLLLETFQRLLSGHQFTSEEVGATVASFIRQLEDAREMTIECPATLLDDVQSYVERLGLTLNAENITWKSNTDLKSGEFRIQSNLGNVDGRHAPLLAQLKETLSNQFPKGEETK